MATQFVHAVRIKNLARTPGLKKRLAEDLRRELANLSPIAEIRLAEADDGSQVAYLVMSDLADNAMALSAIDGAYFDNVRLEAEPTYMVSARPDNSNHNNNRHSNNNNKYSNYNKSCNSKSSCFSSSNSRYSKCSNNYSGNNHNSNYKFNNQRLLP
jgi:hypothetical protein